MTDLLSKERLEILRDTFSEMASDTFDKFESEGWCDAVKVINEVLQRREAAETPVEYDQQQRDSMKEIVLKQLNPCLVIGAPLVMADIHATTMALIEAGFRSYTPLTSAEQERLEDYDRAAKEPVYQYQSGICNDENGETDWYWDDCDKGFYDQYAADRRRILYAAPALPVVPDEMSFNDASMFVLNNGMANEDRATIAMRVYNHCRAAMLQPVERKS